MRLLRTTDQAFLDGVEEIFRAGEVLVVVRYAYGAGNREFLILESFPKFEAVLAQLRKRDSVIAMRSFDHLLQGKVNRELIDAANAAYTPGDAWILVGEDNYDYTSNWAYAESHDELKEELEARVGRSVTIVAEPNYVCDEETISAYVPDDDGVVRPGAY